MPWKLPTAYGSETTTLEERPSSAKEWKALRTGTANRPLASSTGTDGSNARSPSLNDPEIVMAFDPTGVITYARGTSSCAAAMLASSWRAVHNRGLNIGTACSTD